MLHQMLEAAVTGKVPDFYLFFQQEVHSHDNFRFRFTSNIMTLNFTSVANQMLEATVTGTVPDVEPPNTLEKEVALRPMCVQLKVRLPK